MVKIIPENERRVYSREELHRIFKGKWLYLVNSEYSASQSLVKAKVAVVADEVYEDWKEGIYFDLNKKANDILSEYDLRVLAPNITSLRSVNR